MCVLVGWAVGAGWKSGLSPWGDVASGESWLQALASHRGTKDLGGKGQTGHPMPGLAHIQATDQKLSARIVAWLL